MASPVARPLAGPVATCVPSDRSGVNGQSIRRGVPRAGIRPRPAACVMGPSRDRRNLVARATGQGSQSTNGRRMPAPPPMSAAARTPHSGYHFDGRPDRFFEGWYFKVYLPEADTSFALIYSIEDPLGKSKTSGVGAQIMGPGDGYLLQYSRDVSRFWGSPGSLELGATFRGSSIPKTIVPEEFFADEVQEGFQASSTLHQGSIVRAEAGSSGDLPSTVESARWCFSVEPQVGWGDVGGSQQATAGWMAALPVFEPHWQILMAHGEATGWLEWGGKRYEFEGAPAYSEKNWGGGFPKRWFWVQCNSFEGQPGLSLTAGGGRRGIPILPGVEEDVGMLCVHYGGEFIELTPWLGEVQWKISPWGTWKVWGQSAKYEALVEATTAEQGTPLRAPTPNDGLAPFCKDTFAGKCRLRVWKRTPSGARTQNPLVDAIATSAALEVGGGPWWAAWEAKAEMTAPLKALVGLPVEEMVNSIPAPLRPPGL